MEPLCKVEPPGGPRPGPRRSLRLAEKQVVQEKTNVLRGKYFPPKVKGKAVMKGQAAKKQKAMKVNKTATTSTMTDTPEPPRLQRGFFNMEEQLEATRTSTMPVHEFRAARKPRQVVMDNEAKEEELRQQVRQLQPMKRGPMKQAVLKPKLQPPPPPPPESSSESDHDEEPSDQEEGSTSDIEEPQAKKQKPVAPVQTAAVPAPAPKQKAGRPPLRLLRQLAAKEVKRDEPHAVGAELPPESAPKRRRRCPIVSVTKPNDNPSAEKPPPPSVKYTFRTRKVLPRLDCESTSCSKSIFLNRPALGAKTKRLRLLSPIIEEPSEEKPLPPCGMYTFRTKRKAPRWISNPNESLLESSCSDSATEKMTLPPPKRGRPARSRPICKAILPKEEEEEDVLQDPVPPTGRYNLRSRQPPAKGCTNDEEDNTEEVFPSEVLMVPRRGKKMKKAANKFGPATVAPILEAPRGRPKAQVKAKPEQIQQLLPPFDDYLHDVKKLIHDRLDKDSRHFFLKNIDDIMIHTKSKRHAVLTMNANLLCEMISSFYESVKSQIIELQQMVQNLDLSAKEKKEALEKVITENKLRKEAIPDIMEAHEVAKKESEELKINSEESTQKYEHEVLSAVQFEKDLVKFKKHLEVYKTMSTEDMDEDMRKSQKEIIMPLLMSPLITDSSLSIAIIDVIGRDRAELGSFEQSVIEDATKMITKSLAEMDSKVANPAWKNAVDTLENRKIDCENIYKKSCVDVVKREAELKTAQRELQSLEHHQKNLTSDLKKIPTKVKGVKTQLNQALKLAEAFDDGIAKLQALVDRDDIIDVKEEEPKEEMDAFAQADPSVPITPVVPMDVGTLDFSEPEKMAVQASPAVEEMVQTEGCVAGTVQ